MACPHAFRPVGRAAMGAFRHILACSRPHNHHHHSSMEVDNDDKSINADLNDEAEISRLGGLCGEREIDYANDVNAMASKHQSIAELHAVLRHIEVRWQLFNESLSKFHDPEAMLANCTDDVMWSTESGEIIKGKNHELLSILQALIERKVSLQVEIESITRITPSGCPDLSLDKHGHCGPPTPKESAKANAALQMLNLINPTSQTLMHINSTLIASSSSSASSITGGRPFLILAKDNYTLKSIEGEVVERGKRAVLWQQHKSSWYIRGYLCYPLD